MTDTERIERARFLIDRVLRCEGWGAHWDAKGKIAHLFHLQRCITNAPEGFDMEAYLEQHLQAEWRCSYCMEEKPIIYYVREGRYKTRHSRDHTHLFWYLGCCDSHQMRSLLDLQQAERERLKADYPSLCLPGDLPQEEKKQRRPIVAKRQELFKRKRQR